MFILILGTSFADFDQQLDDGVLRRAGQADSAPNADTLTERPDVADHTVEGAADRAHDRGRTRRSAALPDRPCTMAFVGLVLVARYLRGLVPPDL